MHRFEGKLIIDILISCILEYTESKAQTGSQSVQTKVKTFEYVCMCTECAHM